MKNYKKTIKPNQPIQQNIEFDQPVSEWADFDDCDDDYEDNIYDNCPKCGRTYDEIGHEFQYCRACGWDAEKEEWGNPIKPTKSDYMNGEADILTGRWY